LPAGFYKINLEQVNRRRRTKLESVSKTKSSGSVGTKLPLSARAANTASNFQFDFLNHRNQIVEERESKKGDGARILPTKRKSLDAVLETKTVPSCQQGPLLPVDVLRTGIASPRESPIDVLRPETSEAAENRSSKERESSECEFGSGVTKLAGLVDSRFLEAADYGADFLKRRWSSSCLQKSLPRKEEAGGPKIQRRWSTQNASQALPKLPEDMAVKVRRSISRVLLRHSSGGISRKNSSCMSFGRKSSYDVDYGGGENDLSGFSETS